MPSAPVISRWSGTRATPWSASENSAAEAIAATVLNLESIQILNMMQILQGMGENAGPAVPLLTDMLEHLDNEPLIVLILETLVSTEKAAASATQAVINAICTFDMERQREIAAVDRQVSRLKSARFHHGAAKSRRQRLWV